MSDIVKHGVDIHHALVPRELDDLTLAVERTDRADVLQLLEEKLTVEKRQVKTGVVRVKTVTDTRQENVEIELDRNVVEVTRVPMDKAVETVPAVRTEGDTTIVPVIEERLVVVKQLVLVEELHIRHRVERELVREPVELRRQRAVVERFGADGRAIEPSDPTDGQPGASRPA